MSLEILTAAAAGLLPTVIFLAVLVIFDSYKLISAKGVLLMILVGALGATLSYFANEALLSTFDISFRTFSRYVAPLVEESAKAVVLVYLLRTHRIGFLVDGAIMGFAVGTGFAFGENLYFLYTHSDAHIGVWIVRGFGTAIMHGGVMAIFAIMTQALTERHMKINPIRYVPGFIAAISFHSLFNHFVLPPMQMTLLILLLLPPVLYFVFQRSANHLHEWLELDFDADALLLQQINSGDFAQTKIGRFLHDLREKFDGPVVVDMLCYLRLYTELAIRAKGVLMMRENGLEAPVGERTREKLVEMEFLENSIGKTGVLAMRPFLHMTRKDLWQLYVLEDSS